jgi:2-polyprenyl-6-methoxyphenol hydroxylase-like FAD-dependent oxidoreductase
MSTKPILISGAGIGGTLLARSLKANNIPFHLFERDSDRYARAQGYRIRVSTEGINALKEVLSQEQFDKFHSGTASTGGGGMHQLNAITGEEEESPGPLGSGGPPGPKLGGDVLGVARGWLRECLLDGLDEVVHWGKQAKRYNLTDSGVTLQFADGTTSPEGSLVVIADGPRSVLADQLGQGKIKAYDTGARMVHGQTSARAFKQLGVGVYMATDTTYPAGRLGLVTNIRPGSENSGDELGWVFVGGPGSFEPPGGNSSVVGQQAADLSRELTRKWHAKLQPIFTEQNDSQAAFLKMSTAWPGGIEEWKNEPRVTVMGDAVHCMTPAGGVGANTALKDAAYVGRLLAEAGGWEEGLTKKYEDDMRVYASENVKMSFEAAAKQFGIGSLEGRAVT